MLTSPESRALGEHLTLSNQQILTIILIAIIANAVLIGLAVVSMRSSRSRGNQQPAVDAGGTSRDGVMGPAAGPAPGAAAESTASPVTAGPPMVAGSPMVAGAMPSFAGTTSMVAGSPLIEDEERATMPDETDLLDPKTGLASPTAWRRAVDEEVVRLARYHRPATIMLAELDGFERLTERLGDAAGERLLVATARTIQAQARAADRCARLGRGRFAILLPETDDIVAINFAERVRTECDRWLETGEITMRLAVGWAALDPTQGAGAALQDAEHRLNAERRQRATSEA